MGVLEDFRSQLEKYDLSQPDGMLQALLDQMRPKEARHFRLCAIPHQFSPTILMKLSPGLTDDEAARECREFADFACVRVYTGNSYALKEDARRILFDEWLKPEKEAEFAEASRRLFDFYVGGQKEVKGAEQEASRINAVFHLIGADRSKGFEEFEKLFRERRYRLALGTCNSLVKLVHEYDSVLSPMETARLAYQEAKLATDYAQWDKARELFSKVIDFKELSPELRTKALSRLGLVEAENRRWQAAIKRYEEALSLTKEITDATQASKISYQVKLNLGVAYRDMGDLLLAKKLLRESINEADRASSNSGMVLGYNSLGTLYRKLGEGEKAIWAYQKSLTLLESEERYFRQAQVYNNLGLAYLDQRKWEEGEKALTESLKIKKQAGDTIGLAKTYNNLMQIYWQHSLQEGAALKKRRRLRAQAAAMTATAGAATSAGAAMSAGATMSDSSFTFDGVEQSSEEKAIETALTAIKLFEEVGDRYNMAIVMRNLGRLYRREKNTDKAKYYFSESLAQFGKSAAADEAAAIREELSALTSRTGLPWWALVTIILSLGVIILIPVLIFIAVMFS